MKTKSANPQDFFDGIDYARLNTFKPVKQAAEMLSLQPLRQRKLNGILNALTMQIEDGGDSPEVNELLVKALHTAVIFQVGEQPAKPFIEALARFEQSEAERMLEKLKNEK
ncbi:MAG: hypothetical protein ABI621_06120 [Chloroflexota bacterium]